MSSKTHFLLFEILPHRENEKGIFVAEHVLSVLHDTLETGWLAKTPEFGFFIANIGGALRFFFRCAEEHGDFLVQQLYAHFPTLQIEKREEIFPENKITIADIGLEKISYLPLKTYTQFSEKTEENVIDPFASVTASLHKVPEVNKVVAILFRPLPDTKWRTPGIVRIATKKIPNWLKKSAIGLRHGWKKVLGFPLSLLARFIIAIIYPTEVEKGKYDKSQKLIEQKTAGFGWETSVRIGIYGKRRGESLPFIKDVARSLHIYSASDTNSFRIQKIYESPSIASLFSATKTENVLNSAELAGLVHIPTQYVETSGIQWISAKTFQPPLNLPKIDDTPNTLCPIGVTWFRDKQIKFGLKPDDRRRHVYIIGKTGMGKSTLLETMIREDLMQGRWVAVIDPHGDLAETILANLPTFRTNDVILLDPADQEWPVGINMLEAPHPDLIPIVASGLLGIFKKLFSESWGPRLEYILRNTILTLLQIPESTLLEIPVILTDKRFRARCVAKLQDPVLLRFWNDEFARLSPQQMSEAVNPILNKVGQFLSSKILRNIVGQKRNAFSFRWAMDKKKIVIVNLSKGRIGEDASHLLGSMIITRFQIDAMSRADIPEKDRNDFYLYVDEFQNFATDSFATILSEARKYRLNLIMANQYINQMSETVRNAVFGNVGTTIAFQVGVDDAELLSRTFGEELVSESDLMNLPKWTTYCKLLVDGMPTETFSAKTLAGSHIFTTESLTQTRDKILKVSRTKYGSEKARVERELQSRHVRTGPEDEEEEKAPLRKSPKK